MSNKPSQNADASDTQGAPSSTQRSGDGMPAGHERNLAFLQRYVNHYRTTYFQAEENEKRNSEAAAQTQSTAVEEVEGSTTENAEASTAKANEGKGKGKGT
jgi:hypothetical protein